MPRGLPNFRSFLVFVVVTGGLVAGALVGAARWHWAGELAASFRWQLAGVGLAAAALLALLRSRRGAAVVLALALWLGWPGASLWLPRSGQPEAGAPLRVVTVNAYMGNRDAAKLLSFLRESDADVVAVQEVDLFWLEQLRSLADVWPHRMTSPAAEAEFHDKTFGMALLSKRPLSEVDRFWHLGRSGGLVAELDVDGQPLRVIAAHPERPGRSERVPRRNAVLAMIAERARGAARPPSGPAGWCVVLGDLNTSSGSPAFARLLADGHLHDSRRGFGRQPTWRMFRPIPGLWVDIDHVLVSDGIGVVRREVGGDTGSDHRPVVADLILGGDAAPAAR